MRELTKKQKSDIKAQLKNGEIDFIEINKTNVIFVYYKISRVVC